MTPLRVRIHRIALAVAIAAVAGCGSSPSAPAPTTSEKVGREEGKAKMSEFEVQHTDSEWKEKLTPEQYRIGRQRGTERAFSGKYWDTKTPGVYKCAACGAVLFRSDTKFDSGCGWPSFYAPATTETVKERVDRSHGMVRTEVVCARCGAHLGHVFEDGPNPTGLRYCINSGILDLDETKQPNAGQGTGKKAP